MSKTVFVYFWKKKIFSCKIGIFFKVFWNFFRILTHCAGSESPSDSLASSEEKSFPTPDLLDLSLEELGSERSSVAFSTWGSGSFLAQALSGK